MDIYCTISYMLFCVAITLSVFSFLKATHIFNASIAIKGITCSAIAILSLIHFFNHKSLANLLYTIFDLPSFMLTLVCIIAIIRNFSDKFEVFIGIKGMVFLFVAWALFALNTVGLFDWYFGSISYKILIICIFIAIAYCVDRICGLFMLVCFVFWMIFARYIDIYHAMFDPLICCFCFFIQGIPSFSEKFHTTLLKPRVKKNA
ncbi:hypothetical protein DCO58_04575 [Helicobacter saguini]|uniref:Uncharacterized protein n=1 Tax=Helicobacter saguini TaxID=1548018 RepID=A0A347VST6_9HELI|nr:hypothetical protein [Helicobacter saguini]MWV62371.1 hypothetical protein [Helicobacter saguini]MWV66957.1 hypothetical protein [Helicobacter saguini]MWV69305.1 hypothetical protein [Helicobacter saguini]MWV71139.1 hypothetical protein [Helicobacter saguini]TLD94970.1 hypothetical protein LS64_003345 [Helicobacter saguini]